MNVPRGSLRTFLENAKTNLHNAILNQQKVTIVIGNESADLDSITSAIMLAYLRSNPSHTPLTNPSVNKHTPPSQYPPLYIPLLNIPHDDIRIRPELLQLLPHANLEPRHLITLDDLSITAPAGLDPTDKETLQPRLTRLLLTDHNKLAGSLASAFSDRVVGCIDHHVDEHAIPAETSNEPRIITTAGSCTSLVTQYCREAWDSLTSNTSSSATHTSLSQDDTDAGIDDAAVRRTWDAQIATLAMASVLIDTNAMRDANKVEDVDRQAVEYLEAKIKLAPSAIGTGWDREAFFKEISAAKTNLDDLSLLDVLRKDYKQWSVGGIELGISSVVKPLSWLTKQAGGSSHYADGISKFANERQLQLFAIMTTSTSGSGNFQRELLLSSVDAQGENVAKDFAERFGSELGLSSWTDDVHPKTPESGEGQIRVWWQRDISKSRKQVAPLLRKAIETRSKI